jgi:nucleotide-binding universal stress UspA family protein
VLPALRGQTVVHQGNPYDEITSAARRLKVELIVISTHGYTGLKKMFIGSTTGRVVRHAHCPVFVVRAFGRNQRKQQTD